MPGLPERDTGARLRAERARGRGGRAIEREAGAAARASDATELLIDADACPVKDEVYVVAARFSLPVVLVACTPMGIPRGVQARLVRVPPGLDAADDWIAAYVRANDVVVTADIPLASRCLAVGARVIGPTGQRFTDESIGGALAVRQIKEDLRSAGVQTHGPRPLSDRDRSRFLGALHQLVEQCMRAQRAAPPARGAPR